jgi:hypothetical protein
MMIKVIIEKLVQDTYLTQNFRLHTSKCTDCHVDFLDEVPSVSRIKKDARTLYGALLSDFQGGVGRRVFMKNRNKQDGIRAWYQLVYQYETDGTGFC